MQSVAVTAIYRLDEDLVRISCEQPAFDHVYRLDDVDSFGGARPDVVHEIAKMRVRVALMDSHYDPQLTGFMVWHEADGRGLFCTRSNLFVVLSQDELDRLPFPV